MTVAELRRKLGEWPQDLEVWLQVRGDPAPLINMDMEQGGVSVWLTLYDKEGPLNGSSQSI